MYNFLIIQIIVYNFLNIQNIMYSFLNIQNIMYYYMNIQIIMYTYLNIQNIMYKACNKVGIFPPKSPLTKLQLKRNNKYAGFLRTVQYLYYYYNTVICCTYFFTYSIPCTFSVFTFFLAHYMI